MSLSPDDASCDKLTKNEPSNAAGSLSETEYSFPLWPALRRCAVLCVSGKGLCLIFRSGFHILRFHVLLTYIIFFNNLGFVTSEKRSDVGFYFSMFSL